MEGNKISVVSLSSCHKIINTTAPFVLVIKKGEELVDVLIKCAEIVKFPSASLLGIGALENPVLGNYNFKTRKHDPKTFPGMYELTNLTGNITKYNDQYIAHVHVTLANLEDKNCTAITGHLIESPIGMFVETIITPFVSPIVKEFDSEFQGIIIKV